MEISEQLKELVEQILVSARQAPGYMTHYEEDTVRRLREKLATGLELDEHDHRAVSTAVSKRKLELSNEITRLKQPRFFRGDYERKLYALEEQRESVDLVAGWLSNLSAPALSPLAEASAAGPQAPDTDSFDLGR